MPTIRATTLVARVVAFVTLAACSTATEPPPTPPGGSVVTTVTVSTDSVRLASAGATSTISATASGSGGPVSGATITWTSADTTIVRISGTGSSVTLVAVGTGRTTITVRSGGASRTVPIVVAPATLTVPSLNWSTLRGKPLAGAAAGARVVLHERDTVIFSADSGTTWRRIPVAGDAEPNIAVRTSTHFLLLGGDGRTSGTVLSSPTGESWTVAPAGPRTSAWLAGRVIGGQLVAIADQTSSASGFVTWLTTDGITWERRGALETSVVWMVQAGSRLFAGATAGTVHVSADTGRTWTSLSQPFTNRVGSGVAAVWDGRRLAEWDGTTLRTSDDGITWRETATSIQWLRPLPPAAALRGVGDLVFDGGRYLAVGRRAVTTPFEGFEGSILESTDGVSWTEVDVEASVVSRLVRLPTAWMSVGEAASWSRDGRSWENRLFGDFIARPDRMFWSGDRFFMASFGAEYLRESSDGIRWREFALPNEFQFATTGGVSRTGSVYVIAGGGGAVFTSPDGIEWTQRTVPTSVDIVDLVVGGNAIVIRDALGKLLSSSDGVSWTAIASAPGTLGFTSIARFGTRFVAAEVSTTLLTTTFRTSLDGRTWVPATSTAAGFIGRFVPQGSALLYVTEAFISQSSDGVTWSLRGAWDAVNAPDLDQSLGSVIRLSTYATLLVGCSRFDLTRGQRLLFSPDGLAWFAGTGPTGSRPLCSRVVASPGAILYLQDDSGEVFVGRP